jgi:DNA-binding helix-hairpin-helix protein with protein kinase domain
MEAEFNEAPRVEFVVDDKDARYRLGAMLGQGGQGAVFRSDNNAAVKLIYETGAGSTEQLEDRLTRMGARPLWQWPISRPSAVLRRGIADGRAFTGYVMDLRAETEQIWSLIGPPQPHPDFDAFIDWYNKDTGGLRRRLALLAGVAETLAWLHGIPFVYADPSPNNILIPKDLADEDVWLIDPDNIGLASAPDTPSKIGTPPAVTAYTEGYAAPEVIKCGAPVTTLSDRFAFAVIAFEVLTTRHPYIGDEVDNADPSERVRAFRGAFPWIDEPNDPGNRWEKGPPRPALLTPRLRELAQQAFGTQEGRDHPIRRPTLGAWADELRRAADGTLPCACAATYYPFRDPDPTAGETGPVLRQECLWCGEPRQGFATLQINGWVAPFEGDAVPTGRTLGWPGGAPRGQPALYRAIVSGAGLKLTRRHAFAGARFDRHAPVAELRYDPQGIEIVVQPHLDFEIAIGAQNRQPLSGNRLLPWRRSDQGAFVGPIHLGDADEDHRVCLLWQYPAP